MSVDYLLVKSLPFWKVAQDLLCLQTFADKKEYFKYFSEIFCF